MSEHKEVKGKKVPWSAELGGPLVRTEEAEPKEKKKAEPKADGVQPISGTR